MLPQSGGAGGRGGEIEEGYSYDDENPYCADNAHSGIYDGDYCEGFGASYSGCCNAGGSPGDAYDDDDNVSSLMFLPGSGGGAGAGFPGGRGGNGGASILLYSTEMTLNGLVKVNGEGGGGGEGQPYSSVSIYSSLDCFTFTSMILPLTKIYLSFYIFCYN